MFMAYNYFKEYSMDEQLKYILKCLKSRLAQLYNDNRDDGRIKELELTIDFIEDSFNE